MQNNCIIDLFAGCGGMSLGFEIAGYNSVVAVEKDEWASDTYAYNHPNTIIHRGDITQIDNPAAAFKEAQGICGIIGGPPCQAYSMAGRGKLNSRGEDRMHTKDARGFANVGGLILSFAGDFIVAPFFVRNSPTCMSMKPSPSCGTIVALLPDAVQLTI